MTFQLLSKIYTPQDVFFQKRIKEIEKEFYTTEKLNERKAIVMQIHITNNSEIYVNNTLIQKEKLINISKEFLIDTFNNTNKIIEISTDSNITYNQYTSVLDGLKQAYMEIRNDYSKTHFKAPFNELSDSLNQIVRKAVPMQITEPN